MRILTILALLLASLSAVPMAEAQYCGPKEQPKGHEYLPRGRAGIVPGYYWCGIGYRGRNSCAVDALDALCRAHDFCEMANVAKKRAAHSCSCDRQFIQSAGSLGMAGWMMAKVLRQRNTNECLKGI